MADMTQPPNDNQASTIATTEQAQQTDHEAELRRRYIEQQRRMRCVGCGEAEEIF